MTLYKYKIPWFCPKCKQSGNVYFLNGIGIWLVMDKIADNHKKASPTCLIWWSDIKLGEQDDLQKL